MKLELQCACCGRYAGRHEQHWNRDSGFGACVGCFMDVVEKEGIDSALCQYGIPGYNLKWPEGLNTCTLQQAHTIGAYMLKQGLTKKNPFPITKERPNQHAACQAGMYGISFSTFHSATEEAV